MTSDAEIMSVYRLFRGRYIKCQTRYDIDVDESVARVIGIINHSTMADEHDDGST